MTQPTMEEVAGWLREAAEEKYREWAKFRGHDRFAKAEMWANRAAQVEAMGTPKTCDTCEWWACDQILRPDHAGTEFCGLPPVEGDAAMGVDYWGDCCALYSSPKFGCVHHKMKLQLLVKK